MTTLNEYLMLAGILFTIGFAGVILRRDILIIFMCLELMLSAAILTLVAFSRFRLENGIPAIDPQIMVLFIITIAAAEVAIGLAMIVAYYKGKQTVDTDKLQALKD